MPLIRETIVQVRCAFCGYCRSVPKYQWHYEEFQDGAPCPACADGAKHPSAWSCAKADSEIDQ